MDFYKPLYVLKDVKKYYPTLNFRSLQIWCKRGVIIPAEPAKKQGIPSKFSYLNLIEIGLIMQLVIFGLDRHPLLSQMMREAREKKRKWIDDFGFNCFLVISYSSFLPEDYDRGVYSEIFWSVQPPENMLFGSPGAPGYVLVDIRAIKAMLDEKL